MKPALEAAALDRRAMNAQRLPDAPALPEHSTDATGVVTGNADLGDSCQWAPTRGAPDRAPLPGHEHQLDPEAKAWPWLTENRTYALCGALATLALALRMGWL